MLWARDEVEAEIAALIRSAKSLLTATTHVMDGGMVADRIEIPVSAISSDAIAATAIVMIDGNVDAVIATAIGTTDVGAVGGKRQRYWLTNAEGVRQFQPRVRARENPGDIIQIASKP